MIYARLFWTTVAVLIAVKTSLVGWWPFLALINMPHDASLFVSQAVNIMEGRWLGGYSDYTLMKGPITPMWIALTNFVGVPYLFSLHVLYVGACILCLIAFRKLTVHRGFLLLVFSVVLFNPYTFAYGPLASGFREGLHQPVQLAVVALSIILFMDYIKHRRVHLAFAVLFGIAFFMFWNNREEGVWILPYIVLLVGSMAMYVWKQRQKWGVGASALTLGKLVVIPFAIWLVGTTGIAWKNYQEYGVFAVVELKTAEFGRAYGSMIAIEPEKWDPRTTLQADVFDKVYSVPSGEGIDLNGRQDGARHALSNHNAVWLFRRAVDKAGYYDKGGQAVLSFYNQLGEDIEAACAKSKFDCGKSLLSAFPPWRSEYAALFLETIGPVLLGGLINSYDRNIDDFHSQAPTRKILNVSRLVNAPVRVKAASDKFLPSFYTRTIEVKTRYQRMLINAYRVLTPVLFCFMLAGMLSSVVRIAFIMRVTALDVILAGLGGCLGILLVLFTLLHINGITQSTRLYFLLYPVLYPLSLVGLHALACNIRAYRQCFAKAAAC